jgi:hypothetical protein
VNRATLCGCVAALSLLAGCATTAMREAPQAIVIDSIHLSAAGRFVDLRYRVIDPAAATAQLGPKIRPRLIDERTGTVMAVPTTAKLGALRQTQGRQKPNHTYFILFANNGAVTAGSKVTAEIGPMTFRHLTVQ